MKTVNQVGDSPFSPAIIYQTKEYVPEAPPSNIRAMGKSGSSIDISWDEVPESRRNGIVRGYKIFYRLVQYAPQDFIEINLRNVKQYTLENLLGYTQYDIRILAYTRIGDGKRSDRLHLYPRTLETIPSGFPSNVTFTKRSNNKLTVSWRHLNQSLRNGILIGYIVCYSDKARSSNLSCSHQNAYSNSTVINKLQPATKYFVTVAAATSVGYGPKSSEISKITNGERVDPVATSYSSLELTITKPASHIKEVMIIVQVAPKINEVEDIGESDLKPYQANTQDPYVTAYLKADVLPLTFVIGDGMQYNSEKQRYSNQPLKQNSSYIVFLRFFESQDSYYSTEWSNSVRTLAKPPGEFSINYYDS
ncbi:receptor-type tyrosine- phosphatase F-like [Paramuricea clavata]|uniref:Receptor-type tyrosine- phosphatase F-like, partial n=1 Tax=Paramuricea clavata TaxID=317549 RepID=A0A6S7IQ78_PARCT|nr:receptor-type tyrosine- phosphatase F-like [Paramuricea clavata]